MKPWQVIFIFTFVSLYGGIGMWLLGTWLYEEVKAFQPPLPQLTVNTFRRVLTRRSGHTLRSSRKAGCSQS